MAFSAIDFLNDYNIPYATEGKNISSNGNWIGLDCPRCGDKGNHLGISVRGGIATCWKCGYVPTLEVIRGFLGVSWQESKKIAKQYGTETKSVRYIKADREKQIDVQFPKECLDYLPERYKQYLINRNFDPDHLQSLWGIKGTRKTGPYKNRVIAPIYYKNRLMTYVGRDITEESSMRYKACNKEDERRNIKSCLYGLDQCLGRAVVVVEGITDVWRFGPGSVAVFGIKITPVQVLMLAENFDRIYVLFDPEEAARKASQVLVQTLCTLGKYAEHIELRIDKDPAELSSKAAGFILRELLT